ncbi:hypothetical protein [Ferrimonas senticii]|uniref:hypothetical protein n=1 Tax=Ferrimonas senticii TaxID=394566 RepID=UPI000401375D|nr:hypothetical protein [Ferrimonas senticii]
MKPSSNGVSSAAPAASVAALCNDLVAVARQLEQGQAQTPLTEQCQQLAQPQTLTAGLIAVDELGWEAALTWLSGVRGWRPLANGCVHQIRGSGADHFEVAVRSQAPKQFPDWQALQQWLGQQASAQPLVIKVPKWRLPPSLTVHAAALNGNGDASQMASRLMQQCNWLFVSGGCHAPPLTESIAELITEMAVVLPLLAVDELDPSCQIGADGWWQLPSTKALPPQLLTHHQLAPLPQWLQLPQQGLLADLAQLRQLGQCQQLLLACIDSAKQQQRQLANRQQRLQQQAPAATAAPQSDVNAIFSELSQWLSQRQRQFEASNGPLQQQLTQFSETLTSADIEHTIGHKKRFLTLAATTQARLGSQLQQQLQHSLQQLLHQLEQQLVPWRQQGDWPPPQWPISQWRQQLQQAMQLDVRYRGELPMRGWLARLAEGRRNVFMVLLLASMLGYMGLDIRGSGLIGLLILPVFIAGIGYSYVTWQKEDAEQEQQQLERLQQELKGALMRAQAEGSRALFSGVSDGLNELKRQWQQHQTARDQQARQQHDVAVAQHRGRDRQLSQQQQQWQQLQQQAERLSERLLQQQRQSQRSLQQALQEANR